MKVIILQDIIVENNGINIIQVGTSVIIDEGIKDIFLNIKNKLIKMIGEKSSNKIDSIIKSYVKSLTSLQVQDFKRQVGIDHIGKTDGDDNYTTIIKGPVDYLKDINKLISQSGLDSNLQKLYDYDIDDLVQYNKDNPNKQLEDTEKPFGKLYIFRITQEDYDRAAQKAKTMASGQAVKPSVIPFVKPSLNNFDDETEELTDINFEKELVSAK